MRSLKLISLVVVVLASGATSAAEDTIAEFCSVLSSVWTTVSVLEENTGVPFAACNLQQGLHDPSFQALAQEAGTKFESRYRCPILPRPLNVKESSVKQIPHRVVKPWGYELIWGQTEEYWF